MLFPGVVILVALVRASSEVILNSNSRGSNSLGSFSPKEIQRSGFSNLGSPNDCALWTLSQFLSLEGLSDMIEWTSRVKGTDPSAILLALANMHGVTRQKDPGPAKSPPVLMDALRELPPDRPSPTDLQATGDVNDLLKLASIPRNEMNSEIEVLTPDGLPRALLVLLDGERTPLTHKWIDLTPRTSFLDLIRSAKTESEFSRVPGSDFTLDFKLKKLRFRACLGLARFGPLKGGPLSTLTIQIFSSSLEVLWKDSCLPKVSDLLIYPGYVVMIYP